MRITVANLKGGVGKTTTAIGLAEVAAYRFGDALLVDADPQASAKAWADTSAEHAVRFQSRVVSLPTADLLQRLHRLSEAVNTVVIDTPPGHLGIVTAAIVASDVVVVPVQPTLMDIDRVRATVDIATSQGKPAVLLLSRTRARTRALTSTRQVLTEAGFPLLTLEVPQREAIAASWGSWLPPDVLGLYYEIFSLLVQAVDEVTA